MVFCSLYCHYILAKAIGEEDEWLEELNPWKATNRNLRKFVNKELSISGEMELFGILLIMLLFLGIMFAVAGLVWKRSNHKKKQATRNMKWEENEFYTSENSKNEGFEDNDFIADDPRLPMWLKLRKEMIFPKESIENMQKIGSGQFGAVFKGTISHGNAR